MKETFQKEILPGLVKLEHLNEGVKPIIACLENMNESSSPPNITDSEIDFVNLYGDKEELRKQGFIKEGEAGYIISPLDSNGKFSHAFAECTGIVVAGSETASDNNISFMSHQNPIYFLGQEKYKFVSDLRERLEEVKKRCKKGTIDVVIFGGSYVKVSHLKESDPLRNILIQKYINSIQLLSEQIHKELGFYPTVIVGPKLSPSTDNIAFDNKHRRLFITRARGEPSDFLQSFNAKDIDEISKSWKPGEWELPI